MESIIARALEYTFKYWLKSFSRDQFKLQGRTAQLSNLDINGDALHASMGLPPALHVTTAKLGKLEIILPSSVSNVQIEPIVLQVDRLDLVLEENPDKDACNYASSTPTPTGSSKGSGYGFADKIADGMTLQVNTVNLLLVTRGGAQRDGGASWTPPMASITIRNLVLCTTNENWQVVNLKEARDFSLNKKFIYVFKKLEWETLSVDLLPHPDMFADGSIARSNEGASHRDEDGAKRAFFGGERFIEGISAQAYITVQRTELNSPLGLEVQLHVTEAVCPALSEPGLRALLRFLSGLYVCLNRDDVDLTTQQATVSDGETASNLTKITVAGLFLRDTFSRPPNTLVQPSMQAVPEDLVLIPDFAKDFCPVICPLGDQQWQINKGVPLICLHTLQVKPSPAPPSFASRTVISCQPLMIHLQEESCLRISSFLADGILVNHGAVLPDSSVNSLAFYLEDLDITVPLDMNKLDNHARQRNLTAHSSFAGARLHIKKLFFSESPSLKLRLLHLEKDPACFCLWEDQPIDASQRKWTAGASHLSLSLETCTSITGSQNSNSGLWKCVELKDACIEVAMVSADGKPLTVVPPPGGVVRIGVACQQYLSNTSVEQLFFVLDIYTYFGRVSEKIVRVGKNKSAMKSGNESLGVKLMENAPNDTAVSLAVKDLQLRFLEPSSMNIEGMPLVQFVGEDMFIKVTHRTLGGAVAVSSTILWESVEVDCVDTEENLPHENGILLPPSESCPQDIGNGYPQLRAVFWVHKKGKHRLNDSAYAMPFLDMSMVHVIPLSEGDRECHSLSLSACISGVRLGGGMNYAEALLHRFGILGPDGGPGEGLSKGIEHLSEGPLSKLFKASPLSVEDVGEGRNSLDGKDGLVHLGLPDDVDICVELKDWLFALEGAQEMEERCCLSSQEVGREERSWHTTFQSVRAKAKSIPRQGKPYGTQRHPVELVTVSVDGLQTLKPQVQKDLQPGVLPANGIKESAGSSGGINVEIRMVISEDNAENEMDKWMVENLKFSVKEPIEAIVTKDEVEHLAFLCKSEVESMGRIAAGVLRLLKLEKTIGQSAIDQLGNLGSGGFDKIFSPHLSRRSSGQSIGQFSLEKSVTKSPHTSLESTLTSLEEAVSDSQAKCAALVTNLGSTEYSSDHLASINQLREKIESMQSLLMQLRSQI
ncbi:Chorein N domain-containing protein [Citrus sinensis]|uniref:Chorein N domain-containing protein n=1 Tax=Citrus sinensis TaxID=2711 RepID=A0ACB8NZV7_CITSI|nr:Chorein N domain-containing protein [Citrus sinensis]